MRRNLTLGVALALTTSCAAASATARPLSAAGQNVLTATEIVASRVTDVYQAVSQLRPQFLRRHFASPTLDVNMAPMSVSVYLDDLLVGGVETLREIPLGQVRLIRYLDPMEADLRYGGSHPAGAILVTTLR